MGEECVTVQLDAETKQHLKRIADSQYRSLSSLVRVILNDFLQKELAK